MPDTVPLSPETDLIPESVGESVEQPRSADLNTIFLGGLLLLAMLAAFYAAAEIVLPTVLAFVLSLVFKPVMRALERAYLPRVVASLVIILSLVALFVVLALLLSAPLATWIAQLPDTLPRLEARLSFLKTATLSLQHAVEHIQSLAPGSSPPAVALQATPLPERLL